MKTHIGQISVAVEYSYQPFEPVTLNHPGCPESIALERVLVVDHDILPCLDAYTRADLKTQCLDNEQYERERAEAMKEDYERATG